MTDSIHKKSKEDFKSMKNELWNSSKYVGKDISNEEQNSIITFGEYNHDTINTENLNIETEEILSNSETKLQSVTNEYSKTIADEKTISMYKDISQLTFDPYYYALVYPEYRNSCIFPLQHYLQYGWRQGNNPSPYFNTIYYLGKHPDTLTSGLSPVEHFLTTGGSDIFPTSQEIINKDVIKSHLADVAYYDAFNAGLFDIEYYCSKYNDVPKDISAAKHYATHGWQEGRNPSACFDTERYTKEYMNNALEMNPILHFMQKLSKLVDQPFENKLLLLKKRAEADRLFDASFYRACNPNLQFDDNQLFFYYLIFSWQDGHNPAFNLNTLEYMNRFSSEHICPIIDYYVNTTPAKIEYVNTLQSNYTELILKNCEINDNIRQHIGQIVAFSLLKNDQFDAQWYMSKYADLKDTDMDPFQHFFKYGVWEGRQSCEAMDIEFYRKEYMVLDSDINPLMHYVFIGQNNNCEIALTPVAKQLLSENRILTKQLREMQINLEKYCINADAKKVHDTSVQDNIQTRKEIDKLITESKTIKQKCKNQLDFFVDQLEVIFNRK